MIEKKKSASDVAKWFLDNKVVENVKNISNSVKLQKLIFFSQVINLTLFNKTLFDDRTFAFKEGPVVESVRHLFNEDINFLTNQQQAKFTTAEQKTLLYTKDIFGCASADELSFLSHQFTSWEIAYKRYLKNGEKQIESFMTLESIKDDLDLEKMRNVIFAFELQSSSEEEAEYDY